MTLPNGPPTQIGVGGPTPPLVSRGSEEERKMRIPTDGPPTSLGGGSPTSPPILGGRGGPTPGSDEAPLTHGGDEEPPPTGERGASTYSGRRRRASPDSERERRTSPNPGREEEGRGKGGGEPTGPIKSIDTTVPHEPGTSYARSKRESPPKKGQTERNRHK